MSGPDLDLFTAPLPDHLHCPVCLGAAYPPVVVCSGEHIVCHACLLDMIRKGVAKHCPTCRELMPASLKVSPGFKRAVESYEYKCETGQCEWVGSVGDVKQHLLKSCDYRIVECSACALKTPVKHLAAHARECPEALIFCPRGDTACTGVMASANNGQFRRRELPQHDKVCSMFKCRHGCHTYTTAVNLRAHEKGCAWSRSRIEELERKLALSELQLARAHKLLKQASSGDKAGPGPAAVQGQALEGADDDDVVVQEPLKRKRLRRASGPEVMTLGSSDEDGDVHASGETPKAQGRRRAAARAAGGRAASGGGAGGRSLAGSPAPAHKKWLLLE